MFLGASLVALCANASLLNYLASVLPDEKDPDGIFDRPFKKYYDYIVVGSGSAGGIVATRLSEDPVNVLLLEAGGSDIKNEFTRIPAQWVKTLRTKENWGFRTVPQNYSIFSEKDHKAYRPSGKVLGGTSSINGMVYLRGSRHDYDKWEEEGCTGWSYENILPYFKKSEDIRIPDLLNSPYPLVITDGHTTPLASLHRLAAKEKNIPVVDCNGFNQIGYCHQQANIKNGVRCSTASCFLRPVLSRPNLQVNTHSHVTKVIIRNETAIGLTVLRNGKTSRIYAREEVVLSAGAYGSPQILLLSGIGPADHLQQLGIPKKVDLPVGKGMQDHMNIIFRYTTNITLNGNKKSCIDEKEIMNYVFYKQGTQTRPGADGTLFAHLNSNEEDFTYPDFQLTFKRKAFDDANIECVVNKMNERGEFGNSNRTASTGFAVGIRKLHLKSRGSVRLNSTNPLEPPLIDPNHLAHSDDVDSFVQILRFVQNFANNTAWKSIGAVFSRQEECDGYCTDLTFDTDDYWKCIIRHYARASSHQTSTCRMGAVVDPTTVVDPFLRVKGIKNLRVADASVMRNVPSSNINAAAMMVGEKAADMVKSSRQAKYKLKK